MCFDQIAQPQLIAAGLRTLADLELSRLDGVAIDLAAQFKRNGEEGGCWLSHGGVAVSCQLAWKLQRETIPTLS